MRRDRGERPAGVGAEHQPHVAVERFTGSAVAQPLAVGRIAEERALRLCAPAIAHIGDLKADAPGQTGLLQMAVGQLDGLRVDIRAGNALHARRIKFRTRLFADVAERFHRHAAPRFEGKFAGQPRRAVRHAHGGFDHQCARAAHRIVQGHAGSPWAERDERGGEGFAQRRFAVPSAIAAAVERRAARVEGELGDVAVQRHVDGDGFRILHEPICAIAAAQALDNRFFRDGLTIPHAHQLAAGAFAVHREVSVFADKILPRERADALKERLEAARLKAPHDQQNTIRAAGMQVGAESILKRAEKTRAAVFGLRLNAKARKLAGDKPLQTERGGGNPFKTIHIFLRKQSTCIF